MATLKRLQYSLGDWMVGAFRSLLSPMPDLTHFSSALSHVYCSTSKHGQSSGVPSQRLDNHGVFHPGSWAICQGIGLCKQGNLLHTMQGQRRKPIAPQRFVWDQPPWPEISRHVITSDTCLIDDTIAR